MKRLRIRKLYARFWTLTSTNKQSNKRWQKGKRQKPRELSSFELSNSKVKTVDRKEQNSAEMYQISTLAFMTSSEQVLLKETSWIFNQAEIIWF